jgi:hypothetical protein
MGGPAMVMDRFFSMCGLLLDSEMGFSCSVFAIECLY